MSRRPDIDALRVGATLLLPLFHTAKVFDRPPHYHVKVDDPFLLMGVLTGFIHQWHMPLFFGVAGWSLAVSVAGRGDDEIRRDRRNRLLVPLVLGTCTLGLVIAWFQAIHLDGDDRGFVRFIPLFFTDLDTFSWSHLWFLAYLLVLSLVAVPLIRRASTWAAPGAGVALVVAVSAAITIQVTLRTRWPGYQNLYDDWANVFYYLGFLLGGAALATWPRLERDVELRWKALAGVGLTATMLQLPYWLAEVETTPTTAAGRLYQALSALGAVGIVFGAFGFARHRVKTASPLQQHLAPLAFPIYILHQLAIVATAAHLIHRLPRGAAFIAVLSVASVITYAGALTLPRLPVVRWLFGVPRHRAAAASGRR